MSESTINFCETIGGVTASPQAEGFELTLSNDNSSEGRARYIVPFASQGAAINGILSAYVGTNYVVGMQHPADGALFASNVKVSTLASPDDPFAFAVLDVTFKPLNFDPNDSNPETTIIYEDRIGVSGEVLPLLKESLTFADGTQVPNDADYLLTYLTYKRTMKNVTTVNLSAVINCLNKINSGAMTLHVGTSNSYSVPAEHVLYTGIEDINIQYTQNGSQRFDVTHCFMISPLNLNWVYNPNNPAANVFDRFEVTTPTKYKTVNMSSLGV